MERAYLAAAPDNFSKRVARTGAAAWIFGHHHWSQRLEVHGVPLLAAQPGYPGEATGWTGPGILAL